MPDEAKLDVSVSPEDLQKALALTGDDFRAGAEERGVFTQNLDHMEAINRLDIDTPLTYQEMWQRAKDLVLQKGITFSIPTFFPSPPPSHGLDRLITDPEYRKYVAASMAIPRRCPGLNYPTKDPG